MACNSCTSPPPISYDIQYFYSNQCYACADASCNGATGNAKCLLYTGSDLPCSGILTNDNLEDILIKIDAQICNATGDYSTYQYNCLTPVDTEAEFVDAITDYACTTQTSLTTFTGTTFPAYQTTVNSRFIALEVPGITCATASVTSTDTLQQILTKYCTKLTSLTADINISAVNWDDCYTVVTPPTTISGAFTELLSQICQTKVLIEDYVLPTFDNSANCLEGGVADSLVQTIDLLTSAACGATVINVGGLSTTCLTLGSTAQTVVQEIINKVDILVQGTLTFDEDDFTVTATNPMDPCAGLTVALAVPPNLDRYVASNASDTSPGTLVDKITAGTGITLDDTTNPGELIINASGVDRKVSGSVADLVPGYLVDKLEGSTANGITITPVYNAGTGKVTLQLSVDADFCLAVNACLPGLCIDYTLNNPTLAAIDVEYTPCGSTLSTLISVTAGSTVSVCAVQYSVIPSNVLLSITVAGTCAAP